MSLIKTVDGSAIDIEELTLITPLIRETGLPDTEYKGEILIDAKNPFGTLGTIYQISFDKGTLDIRKDDLLLDVEEKRKDEKNKKKAELEEKVNKKLMPKIEQIIGDAKKNEKSVTINLSAKKYHLSDCLEDENSIK
jgi:hypothetical protein